MVNVSTSPEGNLIAYVDGEEYLYNLGDLAWVSAGTVIVAMFVPGLALLYSGLMRRKNALSMLFLAFAAFSVGTMQWFFMGYSLTYSETGGPFLGTLKYGGYVGVDINPSPVPTVPALLYAIYQSQFEAITLVVLIAGAAERARMLPTLVFLFCWACVVYCPVARWTWDANGWLYTLGELDFAGGGPVHVCSGVGAFVMCAFLGPRRGYGTPALDYRPQSTTLICLGTGFIWYGWLGFNGASMSAMSLKSISCVVNTNIAASSGAIAWTAMDYFYTRKYSAVGICSGILAGMIGITPAVGYVSSPSSIAVGALTAIACNLSTKWKHILRVDDPVDAFALHACGGVTGAILTGFFADSRVAGFDGSVITGGWINHNWIQLGYQFAGVTSVTAWTAVVTYLLLLIINYIPGLRFRVDEDVEVIGLDEAEIGEFAYDYLHITKDILDPPRSRSRATPSASRGRSPAPKVETEHSPSASSSKGEQGSGGVQQVVSK
ncbi:hypothetical protein JCM8097_003436 [Rhodosporidiobolus ruineniae]